MMSEQNKAAVRRFFEEIDKGNTDVVDELYADTLRFYQPGSDPVDKAARKQLLLMFRSVFPDSSHTIEDMIAEGDRVVTRFTFHGTQRGELMGIPATDRQVAVQGMVIDRLSAGKIREEWVSFDMMGMMQQLGVAPTS
jgi:steroid delta-isomerase-like uncharacterized protein